MTTTTAPTAESPYTVPRFDFAVDSIATATDVVDYLTEHIGNMIVINNLSAGTLLTADEFHALFARTFDAAFPRFLDAIDRANPELGARLRPPVHRRAGRPRPLRRRLTLNL